MYSITLSLGKTSEKDWDKGNWNAGKLELDVPLLNIFEVTLNLKI